MVYESTDFLSPACSIQSPKTLEGAKSNWYCPVAHYTWQSMGLAYLPALGIIGVVPLVNVSTINILRFFWGINACPSMSLYGVFPHLPAPNSSTGFFLLLLL